MKAIKFCLVVFCCSLFSLNQADAQAIDSLAFFKALKLDLLVFDKAKVLERDKAYKPQVKKKIRKMASRRIVKLKTPLILKRGDVCVKIGCKAAPGGDCKTDCHLLWKDRNKDGKIQPRKELRCVCKNKGKCGIVARKTKCK